MSRRLARALPRRARRRQLLSSGELPIEQAAAYDALRRSHERLSSGCSALAELLNLPLPELAAAGDEQQGAPSADGGGADGGGAGSGADGGRVVEGHEGMEVWADEEEAALYMQLLDLRSSLPATLLGSGTMPADAQAGATATDGAASADGSTAGGAGGGSSAHAVDTLLLSLPACASKAKVDRLAEELCYAGVREVPRRLARALAAPPPGRSELLPHYARLMATLHAAGFAHVSAELCARVLAPIDDLTTRHAPAPQGAGADGSAKPLRGAARAEACARAAAYAGELCKVGVLPPSEVLGRLRALLDAFEERACVDTFCALLDACGRFLYRAAPTHGQCAPLLALTLRLKNARSMDEEADAQIEAAVAQCYPAEPVARAPPEPPLSPVRAYVRHLLLAELSEATVDRTLGKFRKLPWDADPGLEAFVLSCLLAACESRFDALPLVASLISGLARHRDDATGRWVDLLLEHFVSRAGGRPQQRELQLLTCRARLLGELFNYRVLNATHVFELLHVLVPFARPLPGDWFPTAAHVPAHVAHARRHEAWAARAARAASGAGGGAGAPPSAAPGVPEFDEAQLDLKESADDCTRARLVCALLEACGGYFSAGRSKRRLNHFLNYFQLLVLSKRATLDVQFAVADLLEALRPRMRRYASVAEGVADVRERERRAWEDLALPRHMRGKTQQRARSQRAAASAAAAARTWDALGRTEGAENEGASGDGGDGGTAREEPGDSDDDGDADDDDADADGADADDADPDGAEAGSPRAGAARRFDGPAGAKKPATPTRPTAAEEAEFERLMSSLVSESLEGQRQIRAAGAAGGALSLPAVSKLGRGADGGGSGSADAMAASSTAEAEGTVGLRLLSKKGHNKNRVAELRVPVSSGLAQTHIQHEATEERERRELKQLVLRRAADDDDTPIPLAAAYMDEPVRNPNACALPAMGPRGSTSGGGGGGRGDRSSGRGARGGTGAPDHQ